MPLLVGPAADAFVSAEDFDRTGILTGMDPCESRYWWLPELHVADITPDLAGG